MATEFSPIGSSGWNLVGAGHEHLAGYILSIILSWHIYELGIIDPILYMRKVG